MTETAETIITAITGIKVDMDKGMVADEGVERGTVNTEVTIVISVTVETVETTEGGAGETGTYL